jgi:hypothetical protein
MKAWTSLTDTSVVKTYREVPASENREVPASEKNLSLIARVRSRRRAVAAAW